MAFFRRMTFRAIALIALAVLPVEGRDDPLPDCTTTAAPVVKAAPLPEWVGWLVVIGFGVFFTVFTVGLTKYEQHVLGTEMSSEQFNTAGRNIGVGLTAAVIVSQWTWAATLLMSSNMGWRVGVSGPFWYASGATIQILLFAILAIQVKRRASHMHTFMEIVKARFGTMTHCIMIVFALLANMIVTAMLLLGGAATIADLTGMSAIWAAFLIPLLSCWIYTMHGGLKATFFASYVHTSVIFLMLVIFTLTVYASNGGENGLYGSGPAVYSALEKATTHAFFKATVTQANFAANEEEFSGIDTFILNDGMCYSSTMEVTTTPCRFTKRGLDDWCCSKEPVENYLRTLPKGADPTKYCRADNEDCIDVSADKHFISEECDYEQGEHCVPSFLTMGSPSGLLFGITNIVGNFGTVFVDQSYWQSAVAAKPKSAVLGFLVGGMVWFAVPFCMATTNGLAGRALTTEDPTYIDAAASGSGLTPARVLSRILGAGGAFILLLQLFMAITSTGSAEIIAVSSILTYDIYYEYINPELKERREGLRKIFYTQVADFETEGKVPIDSVNPLMSKLVEKKFFEGTVPDHEVVKLTAGINAHTVEEAIPTADLYASVNRAVASNNIEGKILLRVSQFFTAMFAIFMGFLAVFLQRLGLNLGWVYMTMGVFIGSAVGPASLTILMETANSMAISAGAVGGLIMGVIFWIVKAAVDNDGVVAINTLGQDWPWVVGNLCAILGGLFISLAGSLAMPDKEFKWSMLNERIPLVDDVEPPKDEGETEEKLLLQVKIAVAASVILTFILIILWPIPMHTSAGVFSEGGFTFWVVIEVAWALIAGIVIIMLPAAETILGFMKAKKAKEATEDKKGETLTNGKALVINSEGGNKDSNVTEASV